MGGFNAADLIGRRFGRLTVESRCGVNAHRRVVWFCRCDCGGVKHASTHSLTRGRVKSCGCLVNGRASKLEEALREIANHPTGGVGCNPQTFVEIARKALSN